MSLIERRRAATRVGSPSKALHLLSLAIVLAILVIGEAASESPWGPPEPLAPPAIFDCSFLPDPRVNVSFLCGDDNGFQPAFVGAPVRFNLSALDPEGDNVTFTFYFDYLLPPGPPNYNNDTPIVNVTVTPPAPGELAYVETSWTYPALGNFSAGPNSSKYWVYVEARDSNGEFDPVFGVWLFPVTVNENAVPFVNSLLSVYSVSPGVSYQARIVPLLYVNVSVQDPDGDPLNVTWDWGDGTVTLNQTPPTLAGTDLNMTHQYPAGLFPLNETPRTVRFAMTLSLDDGVPGHNRSEPALAEFTLDFDLPPQVGIDSPIVGSRWKVNEAVTMVANVSDPEDDPTSLYWDFDDRVDSDLDGNFTTDQDSTLNVTSHPYPAAGDYNVTLWATDGMTKKFCFDDNCTVSISHWRKAVMPFQVRPNEAPLLALSNFTGMKRTPLLLRVDVYDADGDALNVTWSFGDGTTNATNLTTASRGNPQIVTVYQEHNYARGGNFTLSVRASDGPEDAEDSRYVWIQSFNEPPDQPQVVVFRASYTTSGSFLVNETVIVNVTLHDPEGDALEVTVDWGDGNVSVRTVAGSSTANCTGTANNTTVCSFAHVYLNVIEGATRNFTINVRVTDHEEWYQRNVLPNGTVQEIVREHEKSAEVTVFVTRPSPPDVWDWWDYGSLSLLLGLIGLLVTRIAWRAHRERMEE